MGNVKSVEGILIRNAAVVSVLPNATRTIARFAITTGIVWYVMVIPIKPVVTAIVVITLIAWTVTRPAKFANPDAPLKAVRSVTDKATV